MNKPKTSETNPADCRVVATSTLRDALAALRIPEEAVALLAGFRVAASQRDPLGAGSTS